MKKIFGTLLLMATSLFFLGCDSSREDQLIMVTEATFPPYEYRDGERVVGIDPEIMAEVAAAIGRELVMNPDVILFDEPTSALDPGA